MIDPEKKHLWHTTPNTHDIFRFLGRGAYFMLALVIGGFIYRMTKSLALIGVFTLGSILIWNWLHDRIFRDRVYIHCPACGNAMSWKYYPEHTSDSHPPDTVYTCTVCGSPDKS